MKQIIEFLSHKNDDIPNDYFWAHKAVLKFNGVSLEDNDSLIFKIYSYILFTVVSSYIFVDLRGIFINKYDDAVTMLMYHLGFGNAWIKMVIFKINSKKIGYLLKRLEEKPFIVDYSRNGDVEKKYMQNFYKILMVQTTIYWISTALIYISNLIFVVSKRVFNNNPEAWHLPYGKFGAFNMTYSPVYELSLTYQSISGGVFYMIYTSTDLITTGVLCNVSYQFKILQRSLKNIGNYSYNAATQRSIPPAQSRTILEQRLQDVIEYHLAIMKFVQEMEEVLNKLLLIVFLNNLIIVGSAFYRLVFISFGDPRIFKRLMEIGVVLFQLSIVTFWGEKIVTESESVRKAAYDVNFVGTDLSFQKSLQLIILRSQTPSRLTTGKFSDLRLNTLMWVLKTSYSAFMVLRNRR